MNIEGHSRDWRLNGARAERYGGGHSRLLRCVKVSYCLVWIGISATSAEKSLDVQYYIWEPDATGRILADRLVQAADRGVRVRILVDDINSSVRDETVASIDAHPNIEIRMFNPFDNRDMRAFDFLIDLDRINHRMHNKLMVMDNAVAVVGGRNIGNHYFGVATGANFRDLDIAAAGPVVRDTSKVFDHFWNGDWAAPISALVARPHTEADLADRKFRLRSRRHVRVRLSCPFPARPRGGEAPS